MILESIGWLGAFFFAICAVPQAWKSFKEKHSDGISLSFIVLWLLGEIFMLVYVGFQPTFDWPLITNYIVNLLLTTVIFWYKLRPTRRTS